MKQLALDIAPPPAPAFDNFFPGRNAEALESLRALAAGTGEPVIYLWGVSGSGRSHLLRAAGAASARAVQHFPGEPTVEGRVLLLADDVDFLAPAAQHALFNAFNALRESGGALVASGRAPPARLALAPELLSRLSWGLVYQVHPLDDQEKAAALARHAAARGLRLPEEVSGYLLRHVKRDLTTLMGVLDALDAHSLETRRALSVPLAREVLRSSLALDDEPA
ncbi:MAG: DnaA regulatory inactivator Hda [Betaproteobacteria bacterium]|jgi:DnaA family protein|nr:DnaA regulatory inactivator Hda [Rhodocyclaceae bacterium]MCA3134474.1 DnaA regulatory inactivator Hda [Rhodocyclaceae bacterium]MCA3143960.1 DnaA regulatory inactivator Hda [Rhodocyclaceae bacterium]MCA3145665.1 DnaA regulatory inactivator Hda [Rhodocyclaceae bacterium]MCE2898549.1 DnaA regulatory inactivator Hda [Betaproteobacteria bacterium]